MALKSRATATVNDFRVFSGSFNSVNLQNSGWPTDTGVAGGIPPEMTNSLTVTFTKPSPVGGKYLWVTNDPSDPAYGKAAIAITTDGDAILSDDLELLEMVDRLMDDGDLTTGNIVRVGPSLVYVIEK